MSASPSTFASQIPTAWNALQPLEARLEPMCVGQIADVMIAERAAYAWPWSEGNINDSIAQGHCCQALRSGDTLLGYFIAMKGIDEVHLLNIAVAPQHQRQGWARVMLDSLVDWSTAIGAHWLWLEVRQSNARAIEIYERYGFRRVGERKAYYPLDGARREDALVMNLGLQPEKE